MCCKCLGIRINTDLVQSKQINKKGNKLQLQLRKYRLDCKTQTNNHERAVAKLAFHKKTNQVTNSPGFSQVIFYHPKLFNRLQLTN